MNQCELVVFHYVCAVCAHILILWFSKLFLAEEETVTDVLFCFQLSNKMDVATNASKIFDLLIQYLCVEHIDYAIELGLQGQCYITGKSFCEELCILC